MSSLKARVREALVERAPWLGRYKRTVVAAWHATTPARDTYAQHREDAFLFDRLRDFRLESGIYIDVGANHPMSISNTYLFYRHGYRGVVIEPIAELINLHRLFRPRDIALCAGCGADPGVAEFSVAKAPVGSSFEAVDEKMVWRRELVPVVTLNQVLDTCRAEWVFLLSIDVEGRDLDVLRGAEAVLPRVLYACVESNTTAEDRTITRHMTERGFRVAEHISCNLIFENVADRFAAFRR